MSLLKKIGIGVAILLILPFVIALFLPKQYTVSVSTTINKPKQVVFDYVKLLHHQPEYTVWAKEDPSTHYEYIGEDGTVGCIAKWNSTNYNVGEGEQQITNLVEGSQIDVDIRFKRPFEGESKGSTRLKALSEHQTEVIDQFYSNDPYPMNFMSYFIGIPMLKGMMQENMNNLKQTLEAKN